MIYCPGARLGKLGAQRPTGSDPGWRSYQMSSECRMRDFGRDGVTVSRTSGGCDGRMGGGLGDSCGTNLGERRSWRAGELQSETGARRANNIVSSYYKRIMKPTAINRHG
jgi:hypothetical protein